MDLVKATMKPLLVYLLFILFSVNAQAQIYGPVSTIPDANGFPSADASEGKMLSALHGFSSLGEPPASGATFDVHIRVDKPAVPTPLLIEIFDPDMYANLAPADLAYWDYPRLNEFGSFTEYLETTRFELYPDVNIAGNESVPAGGLVSLLANDEDTMDNQWVDFFQGSTFNVDPADSAACEQGPDAQFCYYHLVARWVDVNFPHDVVITPATFFGNIINNFMVASNGLPFLAAGSTIGFQGVSTSDGLAPPGTSYDGTISLRGLVRNPAGVCSLDIYDGDSDYAGDPDAVPYPAETDDPNTEPVTALTNDFFPFTVSSALVAEGANAGFPADNAPVGNPDGIESIGEPIFITIDPDEGTAPYGVDCCVNANPSGDQEFELYRMVSNAPGCPDPNDPNYDPDGGVPGDGSAPAAAADEIVNFIGPGFHRITFNSMDPDNTTFLNSSVDIFAAEVFDFGDAPDSYGTLSTSGGPQHDIDSRLTIGTLVDSEFEAAESVDALGDDQNLTDDEEGVLSFAGLDDSMGGQVYNLDVEVRNQLDVGNTGTLFGWIDFDRSGTFEPDESASVPVNVGDTTVTLVFAVPLDIEAGDTFSRFRVTTDPSINTTTPGGEATDGEVEDHALTIETGECIPCKGMKDITFKMSDWDNHGSLQRDPDEIVRVRVGNLLGQFSGSDFSAPILFAGTVPNGGTIEITDIPDQYLGMPLTISVEGAHHHIEYGKARFYPDCDLELWTKSGSSYIEFQVIYFEKNSDEICECVECEVGPAKITFKITNTHGRDQNEIIRVRVGDLSGELQNPDDLANPVLFSGDVANGKTFMVSIPEEHRGKTLSITVRGANHYYEFVKAKFDADCELKIGDFSSVNGYLKVKVDDIEGDTGEICPLQCAGDTSGYVKDSFYYRSYDNNNGDRDWSGPWEETDAYGNGAYGGYVKIGSGALWLTREGSKLMREVDVCASTDVWLTFRYKTSYYVDWDDRVAVEVSADGGSSWHLVDELSGKRSYWTTRSYDISEYASANTKVRFRVSNKYGGYKEWFYVDWIKVSSN